MRLYTNTLLRHLFAIVAIVTASSIAKAQEIKGVVVDDKKEPAISATVMVFQSGILKGGNVTDFDGNYSIKPLEPGKYDMLVLYTGFDSLKMTDVIVVAGQMTTVNFKLTPLKSRGPVIYNGGYRRNTGIVDREKCQRHILIKSEIDRLPTVPVDDKRTQNILQQQLYSICNFDCGTLLKPLYDPYKPGAFILTRSELNQMPH